MEVIKMRVFFFTLMSCLMIVFSIFSYGMIKWAGSILALYFIVLSILEYRKFRVAKLILDNQIAFIENVGTGMYISCFGVMDGVKIIKYNMDGIVLKSIVIDDQRISLTREKSNHETILNIPHGNMAKSEWIDFMRRFEYETGVTVDLRIQSNN